MAATATAAATAAAAPRATGTAWSTATGWNTFFLGRITRPARRELGRFDFFACSGTRARSARRSARRACGLVQRAFLGVSCWLGRFWLFGHEHFGWRGHHGANSSRFGQRFASAIVQITCALGFFSSALTRFGFGLLAGLYVCCFTGGSFGCLLTRGFFFVGRNLGFFIFFLRCVGSGARGGFAFTRLAFFP